MNFLPPFDASYRASPAYVQSASSPAYLGGGLLASDYDEDKKIRALLDESDVHSMPTRYPDQYSPIHNSSVQLSSLPSLPLLPSCWDMPVMNGRLPHHRGNSTCVS